MNSSGNQDDMLNNHRSKCRCCFEELSLNEIPVKITKSIQLKFLALTQLELKPSESFSKHICECCSRELDAYYGFKQKLVEKQKKLYEMFKSLVKSDCNEEVFVKAEPVEFISLAHANDIFNNDSNDFPEDSTMNHDNYEPAVEINSPALNTSIPTSETTFTKFTISKRKAQQMLYRKGGGVSVFKKNDKNEDGSEMQGMVPWQDILKEELEKHFDYPINTVSFRTALSRNKQGFNTYFLCPHKKMKGSTSNYIKWKNPKVGSKLVTNVTVRCMFCIPMISGKNAIVSEPFTDYKCVTATGNVSVDDFRKSISNDFKICAAQVDDKILKFFEQFKGPTAASKRNQEESDVSEDDFSSQSDSPPAKKRKPANRKTKSSKNYSNQSDFE